MRRWFLLLVLALGLVAACGGPGASTAPTGSPAPSPAPTRVEIPTLAVDSSLIPLGKDELGRPDVPPVEQPMQASWYQPGVKPGDVGPAVLIGHVNGGGKHGVFYDLKKLKQGDEVRVAREDGSTLVARVYRVDQVSKGDFPTNRVFGDTTTPELRLITCGGDFDKAKHSYEDSVIVFAAFQETISPKEPTG